jgi:hypothetical protein
MNEDVYVAEQVERALREDAKSHELGLRVQVQGDTVVLAGEVASAERRLLIAQVAASAAPGRTVRNDVSVTELRPPAGQEILPLPEEAEAAREVPPPRSSPGDLGPLGRPS